ncbi:MAG: hypothetical protein QOF01_662 [Thermomicrobiales bacterium]|nr:hypothetical protein [Thermomicrobiales bacterium]
MSFMGELSDIGVSDLLYLLALRRQTGKLSISTQGEEATLFLEKGQLSFVSSTNMGLRLGRMLIRLGYLDGEQLREALREQEGGGPGLGTILIERNWITEEKLARCVEEQCVEILARVIAADRGMFVFQRSASPPKRTENVPLNSDRIVLEAIRRTDERAALRGLLPDPAAPLILSPTIDEVVDRLSEAEVFVAASLQAGAASLAEIASSVVMDESLLQHAVISLRERGLLLVAAAQDDPAVFEEPTPIEDEAPSSLDLSAFDKLAERFRPFGGTPSLV